MRIDEHRSILGWPRPCGWQLDRAELPARWTELTESHSAPGRAFLTEVYGPEEQNPFMRPRIKLSKAKESMLAMKGTTSEINFLYFGTWRGPRRVSSH